LGREIYKNATNIDSKRQQTALKTHVYGAYLNGKRNERTKRLHASARFSANLIALSSRGLGLELINHDSDSLPDRRPRRSQPYILARAFHQRVQKKTCLAVIGNTRTGISPSHRSSSKATLIHLAPQKY
jgi:hypothetical protein